MVNSEYSLFTIHYSRLTSHAPRLPKLTPHASRFFYPFQFSRLPYICTLSITGQPRTGLKMKTLWQRQQTLAGA